MNWRTGWETNVVPGTLREAIGEPEFTLRNEEIARLSGPILYVLRNDIGPQYIGMSTNGLTRPLSRTHHVLRNGDATNRVLDIYVVPTSVDLALLEEALIYRLRPSLNGKPQRTCWTVEMMRAVETQLDLMRLRESH